jgi:uncharacterized membrane protein YbaN (DUF454 family)
MEYCMKAQIKRAGLLAGGWLFIVLGVIGLFLPIMQGLLFIFIGLLILSTEYVWAHKLLQKLRSRFPRIAKMLDHAEQRVRGWFGWSGRPVPAAVRADD